MNSQQIILVLLFLSTTGRSLSVEIDELMPTQRKVGRNSDFNVNNTSNDDAFEKTMPHPTTTDSNTKAHKNDKSINVIEYLTRPNAIENLASLINSRLASVIVASDDGGVKTNEANEQNHQNRQDVIDIESIDLASFFGVVDATAFPVFSYSYDTMPPTMSRTLSESPTSTPPHTFSPKEPSSTAAVADDDLLIVNEAMESLDLPRVPTAAPVSSATRPQGQEVDRYASEKPSVQSVHQTEEIIHSPSLRPSANAAFTFPSDASTIKFTCIPPCKENEEICRSIGKGGTAGSCYPKHKKAQKYFTTAKETKYAAKEDKRQKYDHDKHGGEGRILLQQDGDDSSGRLRKTRLKGGPQRTTIRRRRMNMREMSS